MRIRHGAAPDARPQGDLGPEELARFQRQARALGNPTRFSIFQHVAAAEAPVRVSTLVEQFGLNHNAVRVHLMKLCEAGLLVEEFAPRTGPGRPALQYRLAPDAAGAWGTPSPYEPLLGLLLEMAAEGLSPREVGVRRGREAAARIEPDHASPVDHLLDEMRRQGFEPRREDSSTGVDVVFERCAVPVPATSYPEIVCEIHRGLTEGFLQELGADLEVTGLQIGSPRAGGCRVKLEPASGVAPGRRVGRSRTG
jgi:predicted ArsR family transcriptional regulator